MLVSLMCSPAYFKYLQALLVQLKYYKFVLNFFDSLGQILFEVLNHSFFFPFIAVCILVAYVIF